MRKAEESNKAKTLPDDGYMRINRLARYLDVGKSTIWRWVKLGKFPKPHRLTDRLTAWKVTEIKAWCEEEKKPGPNPLSKSNAIQPSSADILP